MNKTPVSLLLLLASIVALTPGAPLSATSVPTSGSAQGSKESLKGYLEWRREGELVIDGQRVRVRPDTRYGGAAERGVSAVPLGYEIEVNGVRGGDGVVVADSIEARPNGDAMFEADVIAATDEIEAIWVDEGRMFEPDEAGEEIEIGRIVTRGARMDRVMWLMRRLSPPYVDFDRQVRVYLVETDEWNAAAMGNGAIWVYTGLVDAMDDHELAVVLGHELAHYTHEHSRREAKNGLWAGLAGMGAVLIGEVIGTDVSRAVAGVAAGLGLTVWGSGYSRDLEDQADRVGLRYVYEAGLDVAAGPTLWAKFRDQYGEPDEITNFFVGSHSRPSDRIANLQREIERNYRDAVARVDVAPTPRPSVPSPSPAAIDRATAPVDEGEPLDYVEQVREQLLAVRHDPPEGYTPLADPVIDELEEGESGVLELEVEAGVEYFVIGVCDVDCDDLDLIAWDEYGDAVAFDEEPDDYPVIAFVAAESGTWEIEIAMASCAAETCVAGLQVYAR